MNIILDEEIGDGKYGNVFKGEYDGMTCAIKRQELISQEINSHIFNEIDIMKKLGVYNDFMKLEGCKYDGNYFYIFMELMDSDLHKLEKMLNVNQRLNLLPQLFNFVVRVLYRLEEHGVIHCDIKPHNILVKDGSFKLSDFGLARTTYNKYSNQHGGKYPPFYRPPEYTLEFNDFDKNKSDVWAFGITILEFIIGRRNTKQILYNGVNDYNNKDSILRAFTRNSKHYNNKDLILRAFTRNSKHYNEGILDGHLDVVTIIKKYIGIRDYNRIDIKYRDALVNMLSLNPNDRPSGSKLMRKILPMYNLNIIMSKSSTTNHRLNNRQVNRLLRICRDLDLDNTTVLLAIDILGRYQINNRMTDRNILIVLSISIKYTCNNKKKLNKLFDIFEFNRYMIGEEEFNLLKNINFDINSKELREAIIKSYENNTLSGIDFSRSLIDW